MADQQQPDPAGGDTVTLSKDDLEKLISDRISQQVSAASETQTQILLDRIMPALAARPPVRPAADVDAGVLPRTRGTIVTSESVVQAQRMATAYAAFDYRRFLQRAKPFARALNETCKRFGYQPLDAFIQICQESGWDPLAESSAGAKGLAQIMPDAAKTLGVDPFDPDASIRLLVMNMAGSRRAYTQELMQGKYNASGDAETRAYQALDLALAAYDVGPDQVSKAGGVPSIPETQSYVSIVGGTIRAIMSGAPSRSKWNEDWNALLR